MAVALIAGRFQDGAAITPAKSYLLEPGLGSYRIGAANEGFASGGALRWDYNNTRLKLAASYQLQAGSNVLIGSVADKLNAVHLAIASQAVGDVLYADSTTTFARLAAVGAGQVLTSTAGPGAPAWSASPTLTALTVSGGRFTAVFAGSGTYGYTPASFGTTYFTVGQSADNGAVFVGYNTTDNVGVIGALSPGTAWRDLFINPGGASVILGFGTRIAFSSGATVAAGDTFIGRTSTGVVAITGGTGGLAIGATPASVGAIRLVSAVGFAARNAANSGDVQFIGTDASDRVVISDGTADIKWNKALVALGGGAAPTLGTIGASGPATAAQNSWMRVIDSTGAAFWVPAWK